MENNDSNFSSDPKNSNKESKNSSDSKEGKHNSEKNKTEGLFTDTLKKVFTAGVSAAFMTEESVRSHLSDLKLPKEFLNIILQQANKSKEELVQKVSKEILNMIGKIDFVSEASKFVENHKFKITAEIEVIKKNKDEKL